MSKFELKLPQMGESVAEATLTAWLKDVGDKIELDEPIFEIATDKVDSEVPSEVEGVLKEKLFEVDDVIKVGQVVAVIEVDGEADAEVEDAVVSSVDEAINEETVEEVAEAVPAAIQMAAENIESGIEEVKHSATMAKQEFTGLAGNASDRFYSPLVKNIAKQEGISVAELDTIAGTGKDGRVTKHDMMGFVDQRKSGTATIEATPSLKVETPVEMPKETVAKSMEVAATNTSTSSNGHASISPNAVVSGDQERIPMSRMGKLIAKHMVDSVTTSAHVQSFVEVDVTNLVNWRDKVKSSFQAREGEKLTFTPIFMQAVAAALKKFPMMNISVDGDNIIKKKQINLGMAAALPDGNLIVPVIKNADQLNLVGMAKTVNDLANRAKNSALKPDEIRDGTYTVTNVGSFGSIFGTPIINQPQVGILALGAIRKLPAVVETDQGDFIGIRSKMFLSHSYDHRVVNGALGGMFVKWVADYLEAWDVNQDI